MSNRVKLDSTSESESEPEIPLTSNKNRSKNTLNDMIVGNHINFYFLF